MPPRPGADGSRFRFALRLSLCSLRFFAPHVCSGALPSEPKVPADAVTAVGHQNASTASRIKIKRLERYHSTCYLRGALQLRSNHGYPCLCDGGLPAYPFPATSQTRLGSRRSSPANRRLEAEAAPAPTGSPRSAVLDCAPPAVGGLVRSPDHRQAGDRGFLASCRIPAVVAVAVSATPTGATKGA